MDLEITVGLEADRRAVLALSGSIDLQSREVLLETARKACEVEVTGLVVDLSAVTFMDSTGIGALVQLGGLTEDNGLSFALRDPSERVMRVLTVLGLEENWPLEQVRA